MRGGGVCGVCVRGGVCEGRRCGRGGGVGGEVWGEGWRHVHGVCTRRYSVCVLFTCMASLLIKRRRLLPGSHSRHAACRTRPQAEPHPDRKTEASRASRLLQWPDIRNITQTSYSLANTTMACLTEHH